MHGDSALFAAPRTPLFALSRFRDGSETSLNFAQCACCVVTSSNLLTCPTVVVTRYYKKDTLRTEIVERYICCMYFVRVYVYALHVKYLFLQLTNVWKICKFYFSDLRLFFAKYCL